MLPVNVLRYGSPDPLPPRISLRAGPLSLYYQDGGLRDIRLGSVEIVRRIYMAVRDRNWATVPPDYSDTQIDRRADSFRITFTARHQQGEADSVRIDFAWRAEITGSADGVVAFKMDGLAQSTFLKNRIGFCALLPADSAGAMCEVEHVDGRVESARLPEFISPAQPVPPFADMRALRCQIDADGDRWAEMRFEGDVFEMEDQRNWTDASFKIYCTPLGLPFPVRVEAGTRIAQSVRVWPAPARYSPALIGAMSRPQSLSVRAGAPLGHALPSIGLGMASHDQPLSPREISRLKSLGLAHLRVDLRPAEPAFPQVLQQATAGARALGIPLEAAVLVPQAGDADEALRRLIHWLNETRPSVARWLVCPEREFSGSAPLSEATLRLARDQLAAYDPATPFIAGTNTDFIFLQRAFLPLSLLDGVCLAINPQAHAFDNASLMETTRVQAAVVRSARRLVGDRAVVVSPVTLKPRFNPYATGSVQETSPGQLPAQVDARQMALFAASWTVASLKYLAESGAHSATYYETTGWRGVMETESGSPPPFPSLPGAVFPVYHVLADAGEFAGGDAAAGLSSDPSRVVSLVLRKGNRQRILMANLTEDAQMITVEGVSGPARSLTLDEKTAEQAMRSPEMFRQQRETRRASRSGAFKVRLGPYGVARVDDWFEPAPTTG